MQFSKHLRYSMSDSLSTWVSRVNINEPQLTRYIHQFPYLTKYLHMHWTCPVNPPDTFGASTSTSCWVLAVDDHWRSVSYVPPTRPVSYRILKLTLQPLWVPRPVQYLVHHQTCLLSSIRCIYTYTVHLAIVPFLPHYWWYQVHHRTCSMLLISLCVFVCTSAIVCLRL